MPQVLRWQSTTQAFIEPLGDGQALTMLRIPAGRFLMGSPDHESGRAADEGPLHEVELQEFLLASTPITQAQWRVVAAWEPRQGAAWQSPLPLEPSLFQGERASLSEGESDTSRRPVERISWEEAMEFCRRLSQRSRRRYTLPSEAQWEYACRAGSSTAYAFGSELTAELATLRFHAGRLSDPGAPASATAGQQTTPVQVDSDHPANAWGLRDMHGNVREWCLDHWHDSYRGAPHDGSAWIDAEAPATAERVVRGGSWMDLPSEARSACRRRLSAQSREPIVGLRVVCLPGGGQPDPLAPDRQALVVWLDDRHDNNRRERAALEDDGVRFLLASSQDEVMGMLASAPVDLLISNMHRHTDPDAGVRLLGQIRAAKVFVPVIFYGGLVNNARIKAALEAGAVAVIDRPDQLRKAVRSVLAGTIA
jgi:formylglycine-generating enzyme required for sulfatase activity/CheY-like chemotaxis protein